MLHRDVKPSNCFMDADGKVKIGDFGLSISTLARAETHLTTTGTFLGTPAFTSPEQLRGKALEVQSDIYSVGATLYFLLTGRPPFDTGNAVELVAAILHECPPNPRAARSQVPKRLAKTVMRCLSKDPSDRWRSYAELKKTLLPFSSLQLTPAGRELRHAALAIDFLVLGVPVWWAVDHGLLALGGFIASNPWFPLMLFLVIYFSVTEGLWGASLGKALSGIAVVGVSNGAPPGLARAFARTAVFFMGPTLLSSLLSSEGSPVILLALLSPLFLLALTGLHEKLSQTRVVLRPAPNRHRVAVAPGDAQNGTEPRLIGP